MCEENDKPVYGIRYFRNKDYKLRLEWYSTDGVFHTDFFCTRSEAGNHNDVSYVHISEDPEEELRKFLAHCPLHNIRVFRDEK